MHDSEIVAVLPQEPDTDMQSAGPGIADGLETFCGHTPH